MFFLIKLIIALVILVLIASFLRTWQEDNSENGKAFAASMAPSPAPDGFYKGTVNSPFKVTWTGKKFNAASSTGINIFDENGTSTEKYPFKTSVSVTILNIDYDVPENPFWIRPILDKLVETAPGEYLGKLTMRIIPGYPFTLGFFRLEK